MLGLYLGDGCISVGGNPAKGAWVLRIFCADAGPGLLAECQAAMGTIAPGNKVGTRSQVGCTEVICYWRHWPCLFPQHGSADILGLCGQALDRLGVDWRFSRRTTISVARREAVARLDEFVGAKY